MAIWQCSPKIRIFIFDSRYTKFYYTSLDSQKKELFKLMSYMTIGKEVTKQGGEKLENLLFNF